MDPQSQTPYKTSTDSNVEEGLDNAVVSPGSSTNKVLPWWTSSIEIHCINSLTLKSNTKRKSAILLKNVNQVCTNAHQLFSFSSCDHELWTMTWTFKLHIWCLWEMNQHVKYLVQGHFFKVVVWTHRRINSSNWLLYLDHKSGRKLSLKILVSCIWKCKSNVAIGSFTPDPVHRGTIWCHASPQYPVGHKKRATLLWTITSTFLNGFQQLMHQWKKE